MDENSLEESIRKVISYNVVSVFSIFVLLVIYGLAKDYLMYSLYSVAETLQMGGMMPSIFTNAFISVANTLDIIPQFIDLIWLLLTITLFIELILASYYAGRKTWFSSLGFLTFGMLVFMFLTSITVQIASWVQVNLIDGLFSGLVLSMPFFSFYMANVFIINLFVITLCIVSNFLDFDFSGFSSRKDRENVGQQQEVF
jgi:hypothetical protein